MQLSIQIRADKALRQRQARTSSGWRARLGLGRIVALYHLLIHFIPDLLTDSAPLFLKRQCEQTLRQVSIFDPPEVSSTARLPPGEGSPVPDGYVRRASPRKANLAGTAYDVSPRQLEQLEQHGRTADLGGYASPRQLHLSPAKAY